MKNDNYEDVLIREAVGNDFGLEEDVDPNPSIETGKVWNCPRRCNSENIDWPSLTAIPLCGNCNADIHWSEIR